MAKLTYVAESGIWTVRGDGAAVAYPITPAQAINIDDVQFLDIIGEAEQLDELSRRTLAGYVQKAASSRDTAARTIGKAEARGKYGPSARTASKTTTKRTQGMAQALRRLAYEQFQVELTEEQLDELSRHTLANYTQKAVIDKGDADRHGVLASVTGADAEKAKQDSRSRKRWSGILKATNKLAKEDVENILDSLDEEMQEELAKEVFEGQGSIIDQLRAAADINTVEPVRFADGHSTTVPLQAARHAMGKYEAQKTARGKQALARQMGTSLNGFKAAMKEEEEAEMEVTKEQFEEIMARVNADEQLDEISKKTLGSYINKATGDIQGHAMAAAKAGAEYSAKGHGFKAKFAEFKKHNNVVRKRTHGIEDAVGKLTGHNNYSGKPKRMATEEVELEEGLRLQKTYTSADGKKTAKVYKDHEWDEHRVKFYTNGEHHKDADHHGDADDAHDTAKHWIGEATKFDDEADDRAEAVANRKAKKAGDLMKRWRSKEKRQFEAEEQIDEISAGKVGSYLRKAADDRDKTLAADDDQYDRKRHEKRWKGIETGKAKLVGGPGAVKRSATNEEVIDEKARFDDDDGSEVADKLATKSLKKAYVRMRKSRALEKRKFEDVVYVNRTSADVEALAESALSPSFAEKLKNIVSQNRSIDEEAKVKDFASRLDEAYAHTFHNYLTKHAGLHKVGETTTKTHTIHHYAHPDGEHHDGTGNADTVDVHVDHKTGQAHSVSMHDQTYNKDGDVHHDAHSLAKYREQWG